MEEGFSKAASEGNLETMKNILNEDSLILDKILSGSFRTNPLHVAISRNQVESVKWLLNLNKDLAEVLEFGRSPLHVAASKGNIEIVKALVYATKKMCFICNQHGMNPVHVAAVEGKEEVLAELVRACPQAARMRTYGNETILHLCVKHGQLTILRQLLGTDIGSELINARDCLGNTILHLAVFSQDFEIVLSVVTYNEINSNVHNMRQKLDLDALNADGHTALDIVLFSGNTNYRDCLRWAKCHRATGSIGRNWLLAKKETLMVVASLIATMAFQAAVSPPSGVWQDNSDGHKAGEAVMAYRYPDTFSNFLRINTVAFVSSLSTIFLLLISDVPSSRRFYGWFLVMVTWLTITFTALTYGFSITVITPEKDKGSLTNTIVGGVIAWCSVMALLLLRHTGRVIGEASKHYETEKETSLNEDPNLDWAAWRPPQAAVLGAHEIPAYLAGHHPQSQHQVIHMARDSESSPE